MQLAERLPLLKTKHCNWPRDCHCWKQKIENGHAIVIAGRAIGVAGNKLLQLADQKALLVEQEALLDAYYALFDKI